MPETKVVWWFYSPRPKCELKTHIVGLSNLGIKSVFIFNQNIYLAFDEQFRAYSIKYATQNFIPSIFRNDLVVKCASLLNVKDMS